MDLVVFTSTQLSSDNNCKFYTDWSNIQSHARHAPGTVDEKLFSEFNLFTPAISLGSHFQIKALFLLHNLAIGKLKKKSKRYYYQLCFILFQYMRICQRNVARIWHLTHTPLSSFSFFFLRKMSCRNGITYMYYITFIAYVSWNIYYISFIFFSG